MIQKKLLYDGCTILAKLSAVLRMNNLKAENRCSDKSFIDLLKILKNMLSEDNELLDHKYDLKKIMCSMGMNYKRVHICPNDYILYQKDYKSFGELFSL